MDFHDGISCQCLQLEGQDLVQCLLISFCFGSEILVQFGHPQPPKNTPKPPKHFEYELTETLRLYNFCKFGARDLEFGTVFTNIILPWIQNSEINWTTPTPPKKPKTPPKGLMDFHDGITCQRFELEGWDLVKCFLISFFFGSEGLVKFEPP